MINALLILMMITGIVQLVTAITLAVSIIDIRKRMADDRVRR